MDITITEKPKQGRAIHHTETEVTAMPKRVGEWQASMEIAFEAGLRWGQGGKS